MIPVKFSHKAATLSRAKSSGACHVRYGHRSKPTVIDMVCPKCGLRAVASLISQEPVGAIVSDLHPAFHDDRWSVICTQCAYRASSISGADVTPFFWEFEAAGCRVWAWNQEHLRMLSSALLEESTTGHPYDWFRAYIHREWLLKRNRLRVAKEIAKQIANQTVQRTGASRFARARKRTSSAAGSRR
jgi:hypothetical protein